MLDDGLKYRIFSILSSTPQVSQRALASDLGLSLGKINYAIRRLMEKGFIKAVEFYNAKNKRAYSYILTSKGIEEKANVTVRYFKKKMKEYEELKKELDQLREDIAKIEKEGMKRQ